MTSSGLPVPRGRIRSVTTLVDSQGHPTNETTDPDPLILDFDDKFPHSRVIRALPPVTTGNHNTVSLPSQYQLAQIQLQYQMMLPTQAHTQGLPHFPLNQDLHLQQLLHLSSLQPSTVSRGCHFAATPQTHPLPQQQEASTQLLLQQAFLPSKNDFTDPDDLTYSEYSYAGRGFSNMDQNIPMLINPSQMNSAYQSVPTSAPMATSILKRSESTTSSDPHHVFLPNSYAGLKFSRIAQNTPMSINSLRMNPTGQGAPMSASMVSSTLHQKPLFTIPSDPLHVSFPGLELPNMDQDIAMLINTSQMNSVDHGVPMSALMTSSILNQQPLFTTPSDLHHVSLPTSFARLESPSIVQNVPMSIGSPQMDLISQNVLVPAPMISPTLKEQQDYGSISDDSDLTETLDLNASARRKKRVRKPSKSSVNKPKMPPRSLHVNSHPSDLEMA